MKDKNSLNSAKGFDQGSQSLDQYMLEQAEVNKYEQLIKVINAQLYSLLTPVATYYSEYDAENKGLQMKEIKAEPSVVESALKIGGKELFSTIAPVNDDIYGKFITDSMVIFSTLNDLTGGVHPETVSESIGKVLNINSYLRLAYMIDGKLYGTSVIALKKTTDHKIMKLLKTYTYFTSMSLKRVLAEEALRNSEEKYRFLAENMGDVAWTMDLELNTTYISPSSTRVYGFTPEERTQQTVDQIMTPESLIIVAQKLQEELAKEENGSDELKSEIIESEMYHKNGGTVWVESLVKVLRGSDGKITGVYGSSRDISDRKKAEDALRESEEKYRQITENISDVIWITDAELNTLYISSSIEKLTGESVDDYMSRSLEERHPPDSLNKLLQTFQEEMEKEKGPFSKKNRTLIIEVQHYKADGSIIWISMHISAIRDKDGNLTGLQGVTRDITDRKKAEEKIRYIGFHDQLTDLYNRHYFEKCKEELKEIPQLSVIMTDVNGLKLINDTYGHEAGDELIKKYAELLRKSFKESDLIFRWGGDEFIVILKNTQEAKSWELCNRLIKHCGKVFVKDIPLSISVGISSKLQGGNIDEAIKEAEDMMYKNKLTESKSSKNLIMKTLQQTLSEKSFETKEHIDRMTLIGRQFGERLGLSPSELSRLETLTMLHDIGKINLDSHILLKETALTDREWEEIKKHPEVGYRITRTAEEFAYVAEEILAHHERWDGKGYPQGLQGEDIPHLARLLNLIDSYDVMSNGRPYKKKMSVEEIIEEIERCSGKQFDPLLAEEFIKYLTEFYIGNE